MTVRLMRLIVMFDLPVAKKADRKRYQQFRTFLIKDGYSMMQFSVYTRITNGSDGIDKHMNRLRCNLPPKGNVRVLTVTEKQYESIWFLVGKPSVQEKTVGAQLQINL